MKAWHTPLKCLSTGMTWPLPTAKIIEFLHGCDRVLVLEEGADLLEQDIRALVQKHDIHTRIEGKDAGLTGQGEYSTTLVMEGTYCPSICVTVCSMRFVLTKYTANNASISRMMLQNERTSFVVSFMPQCCYAPFFSSFAQVSRRVVVRLNTGSSLVLSLSLQK